MASDEVDVSTRPAVRTPGRRCWCFVAAWGVALLVTSGVDLRAATSAASTSANASGPVAAHKPAATAADLKPIRPFLEAHCYDCHAGDNVKGNLDLEKLDANLADPAALAKWVGVNDRVARGEMPPEKKAKAADPHRPQFLATLGSKLTEASAARAHTVIRRLNRVEYENTLRDLLDVHTDVQDMLPEDGKAFGFDNVGEALDLSPVQLQRYMEAAGKALDDAAVRGPKPESTTVTADLAAGSNKQFVNKHWLPRPDGGMVFFGDGTYPAIKPGDYRAPADGRYRITLTASAYQSDQPIVTAAYLGSEGNVGMTLAGYYQFPPNEPKSVVIDGYLRKGGTVKLMPQDLKFRYDHLMKQGPAAYQGAGLSIAKLQIEGPTVAEWPGRGHTVRFGDLEAVDTRSADAKKKNYKANYEVVSKDPKADVRRLLTAFASAAFRRPATAAEVAPFLALAEAEMADGAKFEQAMRTAQIAVLCSPEFLYLVEPAGTLDGCALASRLSYMLWGTLPDAALLEAAAAGKLATSEGLRAQTERLLADLRAKRFTTSFSGQWLNLRDIDFTTPDKQLYPEYDDQLKLAMVAETEGFFDEVLGRNLSLLSFVDSDWTILNERLARHYGIDGVIGTEMRRVPLKPEYHRGGVLAHAAVLKVSANGTTTSPVVRGAWVLERIVGFRPPPPPPGVPGVEPDIRGATTLRQQLDQHRNNASCVSCHKVIDPPGFALENYDVMGGWRANYRSLGKQFPAAKVSLPGNRGANWRVGPPVDATGTTADGRAFNGLADYKKILLADKDRLARAMVERVATYAAGRGMGFSDRPAIGQITKAVAAKGYGFRDLVHAVVQSEIFRTK
jgi:hypothetical protein